MTPHRCGGRHVAARLLAGDASDSVATSVSRISRFRRKSLPPAMLAFVMGCTMRSKSDVPVDGAGSALKYACSSAALALQRRRGSKRSMSAKRPTVTSSAPLNRALSGVRGYVGKTTSPRSASKPCPAPARS